MTEQSYKIMVGNMDVWDTLKDVKTPEQFKSIWTSVALAWGLVPDTKIYTEVLRKVINDYWAFSLPKGVVVYNYLSEFLR